MNLLDIKAMEVLLLTVAHLEATSRLFGSVSVV